MTEWGRFLRYNFDKLILLALFVYVFQQVVHFSHDGRDSDHILWARETAGTVLGGLLGLITGHSIAAARQEHAGRPVPPVAVPDAPAPLPPADAPPPAAAPIGAGGPNA